MLDRALAHGYWFFFDRAGWTKDQVDAANPLYLWGLREVDHVINELREAAERRAERNAR